MHAMIWSSPRQASWTALSFERVAPDKAEKQKGVMSDTWPRSGLCKAIFISSGVFLASAWPCSGLCKAIFISSGVFWACAWPCSGLHVFMCGQTMARVIDLAHVLYGLKYKSDLRCGRDIGLESYKAPTQYPDHTLMASVRRLQCKH